MTKIEPFNIKQQSPDTTLVMDWNSYIKAQCTELSAENAYNLLDTNIKQLRVPIDNKELALWCQLLTDLYHKSGLELRSNVCPVLLGTLWKKSVKDEDASALVRMIASDVFDQTDEFKFIHLKPYEPTILNLIYKNQNLYILNCLNRSLNSELPQPLDADIAYVINNTFNTRLSRIIDNMSFMAYSHLSRYMIENIDRIMQDSSEYDGFERILTISFFLQRNTTENLDIQPVLTYFKTHYPEQFQRYEIITNLSPDMTLQNIYSLIAIPENIPLAPLPDFNL